MTDAERRYAIVEYAAKMKRAANSVLSGIDKMSGYELELCQKMFEAVRDAVVNSKYGQLAMSAMSSAEDGDAGEGMAN